MVLVGFTWSWREETGTGGWFLAFLAAGESASGEVTVSSLAKGSFIIIEFTPVSKSISIHQKFLSEAPKVAMPMRIPSSCDQVLQRLQRF